MRFYEEIEVGEADEFGTYEMDHDEMVGFGERYDPQPMHTDDEAARETFFGGLVASGWHTCAATMRLVVDGLLGDAAVVGATGIDDLRWHEPVRAGDVLRVRVEAVGKEDWDETKGLVRYRHETVRERDDAVVMSMTANVLFEKRA